MQLSQNLKLKLYEGSDFPDLIEGYNESINIIDRALTNAGTGIPLAKAKAEEALEKSTNVLTEIEKLEDQVGKIVDHENTQNTELRELLDQSAENTIKYHEGNDKLDDISAAMPTDAIMVMWDDVRVYNGNCRIFKNYSSIQNEITYTKDIAVKFNAENLKIKYEIIQPPQNKFLSSPTKGFLYLTISGFLKPNAYSSNFINADKIALYAKERKCIPITNPVIDFVDNFKIEHPMILGQFFWKQSAFLGDYRYIGRACALILNTDGRLYLEVPTSVDDRWYYPPSAQYAQNFMSANPYVQVFAMTMKNTQP